jgi:hypothetical protein
VWTGTDADGTRDRDGNTRYCVDWTGSLINGAADVGRSDAIDGTWISLHGSMSSFTSQSVSPRPCLTSRGLVRLTLFCLPFDPLCSASVGLVGFLIFF